METRTQIFRANQCAVFRKTKERFGGLSNMAAGYPLFVNNIHIRTSEALYQACRFPSHPHIQQMIIEQPSPMTAKMKSKPFRKHTRTDWSLIRVDVMQWCLKVKLLQNWASFSTLLLSTENKPIVEEKTRQDFWGAKVVENGTLEGPNVLGILLMEMRSIVRNSTNEPLLNVQPLQVPEFLLLGKPIETIQFIPLKQTRQPTLFLR